MNRFYLSHIRGVDEEWTQAFLRDLSEAVADRTGGPADEAGVRAAPGSTDVPLDAMRGAGTMVALYAPGYFNQSYCAAEWAYFQQRAEVLWSRTGRGADAVIPVLWGPGTEPLPAAVRRQTPLYADSAAYAGEGLLHLLRLKARYAADYRRVVDALADRVAATRDQYLPDAAGPDAPPGRLVPAQAVPPGHRPVRFVVAAPAADELPEERTASGYYGDRAVDWSPYAPGAPGVLASLAADTAASLDFAPTVHPLDEEAVHRAGDDHDEEVLVLLVDAWAAGLRDKRDLLASLDAAAGDGLAVLEPRSRDDAQSAARRQDLDAALDRALPTLRRHATELERWGLPDAEKFTTALRKALVRAQNDAMKTPRGGPRLPSPPGGLDSFPLLGRSFS